MSDSETPVVPVPAPAAPSSPAPMGDRCGIVAVVGAANAGKSSLINRILGEKVSIVSPIAQTTRNLVRGIHSEARGQIVFLDTPGVHRAHGELGRKMNKIARDATTGVEVSLLVVDASRRPLEEDEGWMRRFAAGEGGQPVFALNKSDLETRRPEYEALWKAIAEEKQSKVTPVWHPVSALTGVGVEELLQTLFSFVPAGPPLFPEEMVSDFPRRWLIADLMREKLFRDLHGEVPHQLAVLVDDLVESADKWQVRGRILVDHASQIGIVLGHKGRRLKVVKKLVEAELAEMYELKVKLDFQVKAERKWDQNFWIMKQMGYA